MAKSIIYGRDNSGVEVGEPITLFAGDEPFVAGYEDALQHQYVGATADIVFLFERQLGRPLEPEQQELIRRTLANVGHLDDLLDECPPEKRLAARSTYERLIGWLCYPDRPNYTPHGLPQQLWHSTSLWHNALMGLAPEAQRDIVGAARQIGFISLRKAVENRAAMHTNIVIEEDSYLADLFVEGLGLDRNSAEYRQLLGLGRVAVVAGGLIHAALKLKEESAKKLTRVASNPYNKLYMLGRALPYLLTTIQKIGFVGVKRVVSGKLKSKFKAKKAPPRS